MSKVILISQFSLPYSKIGSWTTLYTNYLKSEHQIDYVVCERPKVEIDNVNYYFVNQSILTKIKVKSFKNAYLPYLSALSNILMENKSESFIIQVVDNFGLVPHLITLIQKLGLRQQCYIQFFYHGFAPFFGNFQSRIFFSHIDEMVLLTHDSYKAHKDYYTILPCAFNVLYNGIDTSLFKPFSQEDRTILKRKMGLEDKQVFLWCSNDRPKKGLDFILKVWELIIQKHTNVLLLVIGSERQGKMDDVRFIGRLPNINLPQYYQVSDCYLFPTLWHEGFGLSIIEALHCGCHVIASEIGGVAEVLGYGKYGTLIKSPHFIDDWVVAINNFILNTDTIVDKIPKDLYSSSKWNTAMNQLINNAKFFI